MLSTTHKPIVQWQSGGVIPYLGQYIVLSYQLNTLGHFYIGNYNQPCPGDELRLSIRFNPQEVAQSTIGNQYPISTELIKKATQEWLQGSALDWFTQRTAVYHQRFGLHPKQLRLSSAMRLWGSCTSKQVIRLNWRLIHLSPILIDYVLAHELAHLKQMNHSRHFWQEVAKLMPDYKTHAAALKTHHLEHYL